MAAKFVITTSAIQKRIEAITHYFTLCVVLYAFPVEAFGNENWLVQQKNSFGICRPIQMRFVAFFPGRKGFSDEQI